MKQVSQTVKQGVRDAASLAVGVGVLGYQAAQARAEEAKARFSKTSTAKAGAGLDDRVREARVAAEQGARRAWEQLEVIGSEVKDRVEPVIARVSDRVEPLLSDIAERVEPVVDKLQAQTKSFGKRFARDEKPKTTSKAKTPAAPVA
jgi:hypothetical protein